VEQVGEGVAQMGLERKVEVDEDVSVGEQW
jgi:hypothetical protein